MFINRNPHKPYNKTSKIFASNKTKNSLLYWSFISSFALYLSIHSLITKHHPHILFNSILFCTDLIFVLNSYIKYKKSTKS